MTEHTDTNECPHCGDTSCKREVHKAIARAEARTVERIAAWLERDEHSTLARLWARAIRQGDWKGEA